MTRSRGENLFEIFEFEVSLIQLAKSRLSSWPSTARNQIFASSLTSCTQSPSKFVYPAARGREGIHPLDKPYSCLLRISLRVKGREVARGTRSPHSAHPREQSLHRSAQVRTDRLMSRWGHFYPLNVALCSLSQVREFFSAYRVLHVYPTKINDNN